MDAATTDPPGQHGHDPEPTRQQIRGSALFVAGRGISLGINLAVQLLLGFLVGFNLFGGDGLENIDILRKKLFVQIVKLHNPCLGVGEYFQDVVLG